MSTVKSKLDQLSSKQQVFVVEYCKDLDSARAVIEAGYSGSDRTRQVMASKLLTNPKVKAAIQEVGTKVTEGLLEIDAIAQQLHFFIFRDILDFVDEQGYLKCSFADIPNHARQCIEGWEAENEYDQNGELTGQRIKVKLVSKIKAQELAMKYKQMLQPNQVNITNNNAFNFSWNTFYEDPPNVVEQRLQEALSVQRPISEN